MSCRVWNLSSPFFFRNIQNLLTIISKMFSTHHFCVFENKIFNKRHAQLLKQIIVQDWCVYLFWVLLNTFVKWYLNHEFRDFIIFFRTHSSCTTPIPPYRWCANSWRPTRSEICRRTHSWGSPIQFLFIESFPYGPHRRSGIRNYKQ